jgi:hypothetical protein
MRNTRRYKRYGYKILGIIDILYSFFQHLLVSNEIVLPAQNLSGTQHTIFLLREKTMLVLPCVNLIPKALLGQFGKYKRGEIQIQMSRCQ